MFDSTARLNNRVLIYAPTGRDGKLIASMLATQRIDGEAVASISDFCRGLVEGVGAAVMTEEVLRSEGLAELNSALESQPAWSDLPLIVLTTGGHDDTTDTWELIRRLNPAGNVSLLERPLRSITLAKAIQVALRSRRRQYELKQLHESLEKRVSDRTAELERLNREAEGFNYSISHDLRSPLRAIAGTSRILQLDYANSLPPEAIQLLNRQSEAATRLASLIDDLLKLSRLTHREMEWGRFDISKLAGDVVAEIQTNRLANECDIRVDEGLVAYGDAFLVRFVLLNLLHNACKFSPKGGCVHFGRTPEGYYFVRDNGIGFDTRYAHKLFVPFERLVTEAEFAGTGIGLANVKRIVERHQGRVWADSVPGAGSIFYFTLQEPPDVLLRRPDPVATKVKALARADESGIRTASYPSSPDC